MQPTTSSLHQSFLTLCLADLSTKLQTLKSLPSQFDARLQKNSQQKLQQISKLLIQFQDYIVASLRQRIKLVMEIQQQRISIQIPQLKQFVCSRIQQQTITIQTMIAQIQQAKGETKSAKKIMTNIGSGKFQEYWINFMKEIDEYKLSVCQMKCDRQLIQEYVNQLIDTLNFKLPKIQLPLQSYQSQSVPIQDAMTQSKNLPNISQISYRQPGNPSIFSQVHSMLRSKQPVSPFSYMKNQSIHSVDLEAQNENVVTNKVSYQAIEEYKETKTIRKMQNLERKIKQKEKSPQKQVSNIVKLALERKRLLKQLEGI